MTMEESCKAYMGTEAIRVLGPRNIIPDLMYRVEHAFKAGHKACDLTSLAIYKLEMKRKYGHLNIDWDL